MVPLFRLLVPAACLMATATLLTGCFPPPPPPGPGYGYGQPGPGYPPPPGPGYGQPQPYSGPYVGGAGGYRY